MSDIKKLLDRTARSVEVTPPAETVEADLRRGRAALARRRRGRAGAQLEDRRQPGPWTGPWYAGPAGGPLRRAARGVHRRPGPGGVVPAGLEHTFRLTVAPGGDTTSPDDFVGKLVVMLLSSSASQELPKGEPAKVGEFDGVVTHPEAADILTYEDDAGHFVQIQAWRAALGWTNEQLASFAEGVQVTSHAQPGVG